MSYSLTIEQNPPCLFFRFFHTTFVEQADEAMQEIRHFHQSQGISHVLCDVLDINDSIGMVDLVQLGLEFTGKEFQDIRVAVFSEPHHAGVEFTASVINKCGGSFKVFGCEQIAREWLFREQAGITSQKPVMMDVLPAAKPIWTQPISQ